MSLETVSYMSRISPKVEALSLRKSSLFQALSQVRITLQVALRPTTKTVTLPSLIHTV